VQALPRRTLLPPPTVRMLEGPCESTLHKNRVSTGKRALECDLCPVVHTLKGLYESTLHKNRVSTGKRALECELCPGVHMLKGHYKSTLHKNRVSTGKRALECELCTGAPPYPLRQCARWRDPAKVPFIKMGMSSRKKECVWELCLHPHFPTPSSARLPSLLLSPTLGASKVALTLFF
jgi:hypothetical protein